MKEKQSAKMFIYQFMSGVVESVVGRDDDENFDPHKLRKVPKPTTYTETMIHLLKGSIGAGILAMPDACRRVGIVNGIIGIIVIGVFATYCLQLLIITQYAICKKWKRGYMAYPKSIKLAIQDGPQWFRWSASLFYVMVDTLLVFWQLGVCAIYFVFVSVNLKQVLAYYGIVYSVRMIIVFLLPLQILVNLIRDLKMLTPMSTFSNTVTVIGMLLVMFYLVEDDVVIEGDKFELKGWAEIPVFVGTTLFALEAVGVVLALEYNMEKPQQFTGIFGLLSVGMVIILSLFILLGVPGYIKYGDDIKASITLNLPEDQKKAQMAKLSFALALFFSFPLQNFVAYRILWLKIQKRLQPKNTFVWDYSLRVLCVLIPFAAAVGAPNLGAFISLMGAFCLSLVAVVFPAIMDVCIWYPNRYGFMAYRLLRDIAIIILGLLSMVSGVYTGILEMAETEG